MARLHRQAAVIPYRIRRARIEVALVTRSSGRGWILPKGSVNHGELPRDAAIREAEEEAGLLGVVARRPIGHYRHTNGNGPCRVDVFPMRVTDVLEHWLEDGLRRRRWMGTGAASERLRAELRQFVRAIEGLRSSTGRLGRR